MNLKDNPYLKEIEIILEDWDIDRGFLRTNNIQGVDFIVEIDPTKFNLEPEKLAPLLEEYYQGNGFYYFKYDPKDACEMTLATSSSEDIFITHDDVLCFPDAAPYPKISNENKETHIIVHILNWMLEKGYFPNIFQLDYYGNPTPYNFYDTNEYKALGLSDDDKNQKKQVERLLEIINIQKELEERTLTLGNLPQEFFERLPQFLQDNDGYSELLSIDSFNAHSMTISFDMDPDDKEVAEELVQKKIIKRKNAYDFQITLHLLPKSVQYLNKIRKNI